MDREDSQATVRFDTADLPDHHFTPAFLEVVSGPGQGQRVRLAPGELIIGRANDCGLCLKHGSISRRHAQLKRVGNGFYLSDLNSHNGTFLNRSRLPDGKEVELNGGDVIHIGAAQLALRVEQRTVAPPREEPPEPQVGSDPSQPISPVVGHRVLDVEARTPVGLAVAAGALGMLGLVAVGAIAWDRLFFAPKTPPPVVAAPLSPATRTPGPAGKDTPPVAPPASPSPAAPRETAAPPPAPASTGAPEAPPAADPRGAALERYKDGDLAGALALVGRTSELGRTLVELQSLHDAASTAKGDGKTEVSLGLFSKALELDQKLSAGEGVFADEMRGDVSELYTALGMDRLAAGDRPGARRAFASAVKSDPTNRSAKRELEKLEEATAPTRRKAPESRKRAIDEAFDE